MIDETTIRELAEKTAPDRCFVSVYLGGDTDEQWLDRHLQPERLLEEPTELEAENLEPTLQMVWDWVDEHGVPSEGVALFACWADDYLEAVDLEVPVEPRVVCDSSPFVLPLAEIADEFETWAVVLADHDAARIFEVGGLEIDEVDRAAGDIKNHVKVGGWSQQRYERRREKQISDYCDEIADRLDQLVEEHDCERIALAGNEQLVAELEEELPPRLQKRVIGSTSLRTNLAENDVLPEIRSLYEEAERDAERELLERIQEARFRDGRAAIGPEETVAALREGRVRALLVSRNADLEGVRCRDCEWLSAAAEETCPVCGGETFAVDLANEAVEVAARTDAAYETADAMEQLEAWDGMAALLRY